MHSTVIIQHEVFRYIFFDCRCLHTVAKVKIRFSAYRPALSHVPKHCRSRACFTYLVVYNLSRITFRQIGKAEALHQVYCTFPTTLTDKIHVIQLPKKLMTEN